jgi:hypothetical protein
MIELLTIKEAGCLLRYKSTRAVIEFCRKNKIVILAGNGSKIKYIVKAQFEHAQLKEFIEYLKVEYGENWLDAFQIYSSMNITKIVELEENGNIEIAKVVHENNLYQPKGKHEKNFLSILSNIQPEL